MISVTRIGGIYTARWGLTGKIVYKGRNYNDMAVAIEEAFDHA